MNEIKDFDGEKIFLQTHLYLSVRQVLSVFDHYAFHHNFATPVLALDCDERLK